MPMVLDHDPVLPPSDPPEDDKGDHDLRPIRWVTVATFDTSAAAHVARLRLESEDVDCFIADENVVAIAWHYSLATGGIKLQVPEPDARRAIELLASRAFERDAPSIDDSDHCPACGSGRITRDGFTRRRIVGIMFLTGTACSFHWIFGGLLLSACALAIVRASGQRCEDCDHTWDMRRGFSVIPTARLAPPAASDE